LNLLAWGSRHTPKKTPREAGSFRDAAPRRSERAAAPVAPGHARSTNPGARRHHHDRGGSHDDDAGIGTASAIGAAVEAGTASAGGIGRAEAGKRAHNQSCCKKILHVFSLRLGRSAAGSGFDPCDERVPQVEPIVRQLNGCDLNAA
jgi:hypothetical protein